jgi:hypothetical protein
LKFIRQANNDADRICARISKPSKDSRPVPTEEKRGLSQMEKLKLYREKKRITEEEAKAKRRPLFL